MMMAQTRTDEPTVGNGAAITDQIVHAECLDFLQVCPSSHVQLIYIDPPFNTGTKQERRSLRTVRSDSGGRTGFGGRRYSSEETSRIAFRDSFDDYLGFLEPRLREARRILDTSGSLFFHIDPRESHYCKVLLDSVFGRDSFMNEIVWSYDYGGRSKTKWPAKHDVILWYAKDPKKYTFRYEDIDRIPYLAPNLVTPEKALRGKTPTDVWWQTIVSPTGKEKTGYPTQKPVAILERILRVHTNPSDLVLDFFAGSGTTGVAARNLGRRFVLVDCSDDAIQVMRKRLPNVEIGTSYKYQPSRKEAR